MLSLIGNYALVLAVTRCFTPHVFVFFLHLPRNRFFGETSQENLVLKSLYNVINVFQLKALER